MPANTQSQAFPYPISTDDPDVPDDMMKLAKAVEKRVMGVYTTTADRDTKTGLITPEEGMFAFVKADDKIYWHNGTTWVQWSTPKIASGATVPADSDVAYSNGDVFFKTS